MVRNQRPIIIYSSSLISFGLVFFYFVIARNGDLSGNVILSLTFYGFVLLISLMGSNLRHVKYTKFLWLITLVPFLYSSPIWLDAALFAIGILLIIIVEQDTSVLIWIYRTIVFVALVNAICVFIQSVDKNFFDEYARTWYPEGMYQQYLRTVKYESYLNGCNAIAGDTAGYLVNCIGLLYCLFMTNRELMTRRKQIVFIICFVALILTGKRGIFLCAIVAGIVIYILSGRTSKRFQRFFVAIIIVLILIRSITIIAELFPGANTIIRVAESIEGLVYGNDISSGRTRLYGYALIQFRSNPLFGIGWKKFNQLTTTLYNYNESHYVNNDYLQVLCETGIVGLICIYLPMIVFLIRTVRTYSYCQNTQITEDIKLAIAFSLFVQMFYLLYSVFEIPLYDRAFFFMYILSVVIGYCALSEIQIS